MQPRERGIYRPLSEKQIVKQEKMRNPVEHYSGLGLGLGAAFGVAIGGAFEAYGVGLATGTMMGVLVGAGIGARFKTRQHKDPVQQ